MKNLLLIFMMLFAVDSIAQLDQREKGDVVSPALNKNPNFIQKTGWTIEAIDPINDTLCSITPSSDNLTILTANVCNARVYQDINSADIRKARFAKETMTVLLKLQSLTYVKITLNVYKKAATTGTLTLLRTLSLENNSNVPLRDRKIVFDVVTDDLNFVTNANLADSLRIEFTFEPTVVFPAGVAKVEVNDFRVFSSPMNYSPLLHEVREESGMSLIGTVPFIWSGTNGTKGTTSRDEMWCGRQGQFMRLSFKYNNGSGGTAGTGNIALSIPTSCAGYSGLTVDEAVTPIVGSFQANIAGGSGNIIGAIRINYSGSEISLFSEGNQSLLSITTSNSYFIADVLVPIKEWKQSTVSLLTKADIGRISEIIFTSQEYAPNNFIPTDNKSIGNTGSTADYTGSDYRELYTILWSQMGTDTTAGHPYRISSARGASADADWNANKTITIDYVTNEVFIRAKGSDRNLGSYQSDSTKFAATAAGQTQSLNNQAGYVIPRMSVSGSENTSVETRPKNVALNAYIRYRDTMINASLKAENIVGMARYIVKTYQSGTSWYEVNNDCWVRQGSRRTVTGVDYATVSLLVEMLNTNYTLTSSTIEPSNNNSYPITLDTLSVTSFRGRWPHTRSTTLHWVAEGYGSKAAIQALHPELDVSKCQ